MRFFANGPSIPDDLLVARDEGRVVFFCGSGVSKARANLADFFGLAKKVLSGLGVPTDHEAHRALEIARGVEDQHGIPGLISADRVFGFLERDFSTRDVQTEVAKALRPKKNVDLSAHRILLNIATTEDGRVRLVTTNFDRLFESCEVSLDSFQPPRLPDPARPDEINGVIHLHGRVTSNYDGAEGDGFVLSSSEFGRAYLADGWATAYFKEIIDRFVVVFIGYAADDPPVRYLMEALTQTYGPLEGVFAFQSGMSNEATARWDQKGVKAIAYEPDEGHAALWATLEKWAERAKDPEIWRDNIIDIARQGPAALKAHERGQVAHVVSTVQGARKFAESDPPPPADWLCVFDPNRRYAKPGKIILSGDEESIVDPFDIYGLDSDAVPQKTDSENYSAKRDVPEEAWSGFFATISDRRHIQDARFDLFNGISALNPTPLPPRLFQLSNWLIKVSGEPASVWWAAHQYALHPTIHERLRWSLERSQEIKDSNIHRAWRYLLTANYKNENDEFKGDLYELEAAIKNAGWNLSMVREYGEILRPYLIRKRPLFSAPMPPRIDSEIRWRDLVSVDVAYPQLHENLKIPDEWLLPLIRTLRQNLEHALNLENELDGFGLRHLEPITLQSDQDEDRYQRSNRLSGAVIS